MSTTVYYPDGTMRHYMNTEEYLVSKRVERRRDAKKTRETVRDIKLRELDAYLDYLEGS